MMYHRLPFEEYFINTSEDFTHTGRVTYPVKYIAVKYNTTKLGKLFGIAHEVNYEIHYEPDRNVIQIHFQRSQGVIDWIANVFEFAGRYYDAIDFEGEPLQIRVHHGWGNMYLAVKRQVREEWAKLHAAHPDAATEILGWSLGSAIACLCCQDLNYNFSVKPYLYTFGSVRPFKVTPLNRKRMQRYLATLYTECANFADINDLISYLPPFRGFTMIRRVDVGTDLRRSVFRLIHPLRYHVHYDLPELYRKSVGSLVFPAEEEESSSGGHTAPAEEKESGGGHAVPADERESSGHVFHTDEKDRLISYEGPGGEVKVPEGVRGIGMEAFSFCTQVTGVILPESVRFIEERAFWRSGIKTVSLPVSLEWIEKRAFSETPLESIEIPDQVKKVGARAFCGAEHLKKAKLPDGITSLEPGVFCGCSSLKEVVLPKGLKHIEGMAFMQCASLEQITLPEGLVSVWIGAFCGCSSLREIYLGDSVKAIGHHAFRDCTALEKVRVPEGLEMRGCNAFVNAGRVVLTGPGKESGLIVADKDVRYYHASEKLVIPEGNDQLPVYALEALTGLEILDLPRSLKYYSWSVLSGLRSLRQIVTDRDAPAAEIALMLDLECTDRSGQTFVFRAPENSGEWIIEQDGENHGVRLMGCRGRIGHTSEEDYATVILPDEIDGRPVTSIGAEAFCGYGQAKAFYIPDSVQRIESGAFARSGYCEYGGKLFLRIPQHVSVAVNAFAGTEYMTKERVRKAARREAAENADRENKTGIDENAGHAYAVLAADDPAVGTGTKGRPALMPHIWQYLDRLDREGRIQELTHAFLISGDSDGAGWASIEIEIDNDSTSFSISYVGSSPAGFRRFAEELEDGENESFGWESEPGWYPWNIQRRGGIFYVSIPGIGKSFFIPREAFLCAAGGLTGEW